MATFGSFALLIALALTTWLAPRSMVVLKGEARTVWRHGIARRKNDVVNGTVIPRGRRVSITFRYIL